VSIGGPLSSCSARTSLANSEKASWQQLREVVKNLAEETYSIRHADLIERLDSLHADAEASAIVARTKELADEIFQQVCGPDAQGASSSDPAIDLYVLLGTISTCYAQGAAFKRLGPPDFALQRTLLADLDLSCRLDRDALIAKWGGDDDTSPRKDIEKLFRDDPAKLERWQKFVTGFIERLPSLQYDELEYRCFEVFDSLWQLPNVDSPIKSLFLHDFADIRQTLCDLVRYYNDALIGYQGSFDRDVSQLLSDDDDTLTNLGMLVACADTSIPEQANAALAMQKEAYRQQWKELKERIKNNSLSKHAGDSREAHDRAYFYYQNLQRLHRVWQLTAKDCPWMLLDELGEFSNTCDAGWNERIRALLQRAEETFGSERRIQHFYRPLAEACLARRRILDERLVQLNADTEDREIYNPHYLAAAKALLNEELALGYRANELDAENPNVVQFVGSNYIEPIKRAVHKPDPQQYLDSTRAFCEEIGESGRMAIIETLVERYRDSFPAESLFLSSQNITKLESDSGRLQAWLQAADLDAGDFKTRWQLQLRLQQLFCDASGLYLLPEGALRDPVEGEDLEEWRNAMLEQLANVVPEADVCFFRELIQQKGHLNDLGIQLWLGSLGVVSYQESEYDAIIHRLEPRAIGGEEIEKIRQQVKYFLRIERYFQHRSDAYKTPADIEFIPGWILNDPEVMWNLIERWDHLFESVSSNLKQDPEFILNLIRESKDLFGIYFFHHSAENIKNNPVVINELARKLVDESYFYSESVEMIIKVLERQNEMNKALVSAVREYYDYYGDTLASVQDDCNLEKIPESLLGDVKWAINAVKTNYRVIDYLPDAVKNECRVVEAAHCGIDRKCKALFDQDKNNLDEALKFVNSLPRCLIGDTDWEYIMRCFPGLLSLMDEDMRGNHTIVTAAIQRDPEAINAATPQLLQDPWFRFVHSDLLKTLKKAK